MAGWRCAVLRRLRGPRLRTLLMWAGGLLVAVPLVFGALGWWVAAAALQTLGLPQDIAILEGFRSSDVATVVATNFSVLVSEWTGTWIWYILGTYLATAYALMSWVAVPPEAWEAMPWLPVVFEFVMVASMVFLAAGYIATATLLVHDHERWKRVLSILAPVGRMALTNYIAQSVACVLIFYGIGLGLMVQVGPAVALLISLAIFAVQILWSHWWLAHFRFGPLEWLWRMATYGKLQPMGIPTAVQPTATGP